MSTAIIRPRGVLGAVEAMGLRESFAQALANGDAGVIVDLTGVQEISAAGLAAVTNMLGQGRRTGIAVRVVVPEEGSDAALILEQADLRRFLNPGGMWNILPDERVGPPHPDGGPDARRAPALRHRFLAYRRTAVESIVKRGGSRRRSPARAVG